MGKLVGDKYGIHRVIEPQGVLTQAALKIDNDMTKKYSNEIICDVISLNIDSASFTQIEEACGGDTEKIKEMILGIVNERGKMQNPVTGSGGMFIGKVAYIGEDLDLDIKVGDKIVTGGQQNLSNGALVSVADKAGVGTEQPANKTNL